MKGIISLLKYDKDNSVAEGTSQEEKLFMFSLLRMIKPDRVLEIGVSRGHMTCWLALALKMNGKGSLVSVDNWSKNHGGEATSANYAIRRVHENELQEQVKFVSSDSHKYLEVQDKQSFDLIWIDGDHSYKGAHRDILEAQRVTKSVIGVHDTYQQYDGPRKAIHNTPWWDSGFWVKGCRGIWLLNIDGGKNE